MHDIRSTLVDDFQPSNPHNPHNQAVDSAQHQQSPEPQAALLQDARCGATLTAPSFVDPPLAVADAADHAFEQSEHRFAAELARIAQREERTVELLQEIVRLGRQRTNLLKVSLALGTAFFCAATAVGLGVVAVAWLS